MYVYDYKVPDAVIYACIAEMRGRVFRAYEIDRAARKAGAPVTLHGQYISYRIADRIIQQERKAGNIRRTGRAWVET